MKTDKYGNKLFESVYERFFGSRGLRAPFWLYFEDYKFERIHTVFVMPLDVWIPRNVIVKQEKNKIYLSSDYINKLLDIADRDLNACVILTNLNKYIKKNNISPPPTALP